jgi:hypothetical protein
MRKPLKVGQIRQDNTTKLFYIITEINTDREEVICFVFDDSRKVVWKMRGCVWDLVIVE